MFFDKEPWDDYIIIFSHFELFKKKRIINVIIYVYLGKLILFSVNLKKFFSLVTKKAAKKRLRKNKHFRSSAMIKRLCVNYFTYFKETKRIFHKNIRYIIDKKVKRGYYRKKKDKHFKEYIGEGDFVKDKIYSADGLNMMSRFYRTGRGVFNNRLSYFRAFAFRIHFERAATKWTGLKHLFEAVFFVYIYAPFFNWLCEFVAYLVSQIFTSDKASVSFHYFTITM